jgi:hypothetical protein
MLLLVAIAALAQGPGPETITRRPVAGHAVFDLRAGIQTISLQNVYLCAEGSPTAWLSFEACGNGAGILHQAPVSDIAHFRSRIRAASGSIGRLDTDLLVGVGFAEVQTTADRPGFKFGQARSADQIEAAGAEASIALKGRYWADRGGRTYVSADLNAGAAVIPAAPTVMGSQGPLVPFAALTVGLGF